ncbi:MAG: nucleotidyltransferase domain-containing protein [Promethearchaeota archaeon]
MFPNIEELVAQLRTILEPRTEIVLAYLYGSVTKSDWTERSDVDVGLYITEDALRDPWYPVEVRDLLDREFGGRLRFDVRVINGTSPKFRYGVIFRTPKIVVHDERFRVEFETRTLLEWYDMRPTWNQFYNDQREALLK